MRSVNVDPGIPASREAPAVRLQLASILESVHFRNSKRSQLLLRFVVDAALEGHPELLKERMIGVNVFKREAAYDTAEDAIVRNAAVEVRKRLAQYYMEPEHGSELRIDLPVGSYVPVFSVETAVEAPAPPVLETPARRQRNRRVWMVGATVAVFAIAAIGFVWTERRTANSELNAFWEPLLRTGEKVEICVGQPNRLYRFVGPRREQLDRMITGQSAGAEGPRLSIAPGELAWIAPDYLYMRDAFSAAKIAAWVQSKGYQYQLLSVAKTNYSQLRQAPMVAIGAFDNPWAMRVTSELRFVFGHKTIDGAIYNCVIDRRNPDAPNWMVAQSVGTSTTQDYAIVTRSLDPTTERTVISVAGIESYGTLAAGEFVTGAEYLGAALVNAPKDWRRKNIEFVLGTKVIEGTPGPPKILATYYW